MYALGYRVVGCIPLVGFGLGCVLVYCLVWDALWCVTCCTRGDLVFLLDLVVGAGFRLDYGLLDGCV